MNRLVGCLTVLVLLVAMPAWAYDGIVEKKTFAMPAYTTVGGTTIKGVRVGYETYGTLNAGRDNVILVAHFYSGTRTPPVSTPRATRRRATGTRSSAPASPPTRT